MLIRITVKAVIIIPMAVMRGFGIDLYDFCAHRHFDFFNSVENQGAQPAVETIQIYKVLEKQIAPQKAVVGTFRVVLKRIGVRPQTIVTDIEKVSLSLVFIIEKKASFLHAGDGLIGNHGPVRHGKKYQESVIPQKVNIATLVSQNRRNPQKLFQILSTLACYMKFYL